MANGEQTSPPAGFVPVPPGSVAKDGLSIVIVAPDGKEYMGPRASIGLPAAAPPMSQQPFDAGRPAAGAGPLVDLKNHPWVKVNEAARRGEMPTPDAGATNLLKGAALPTAGGYVGSALGTMVAPGPGTVAGMSLGSMAGEGLNQMLGLTEPSVGQLALSGGLPLLGPAARTVMANTPGAEAGLQQLATKTAKMIPKRVAPTESPAALYQAAKGAGAQVPKGPIGAAAADIVERQVQIAPKLRSTAVKKVVDATQQLLDLPTGTDIPLETFLPNLQRLGAIYRTAAKKGGSALAEIAEMYDGLQGALDKAAQRGTGPGVAILRRANDQFKRQLAEGELNAMTQKAIHHTAGHPSFNGDLILNRLKDGADEFKRLSKWLPADEIEDLRKSYAMLAKVPSVSSAGKGGLSGLGFAQRAVVGGTLGAAIGGGAEGAVVGVLATEALTRAMMTPAGRGMVRALASPKLGGGGATFDTILNTLLQGSRPRQRTPGGVEG